MTDQVLTCTRCSSQFVFSSEEQAFFKKNNLLTPKLCPICRSIKAQTKIIPPKPKSKTNS